MNYQFDQFLEIILHLSESRLPLCDFFFFPRTLLLWPTTLEAVTVWVIFSVFLPNTSKLVSNYHSQNLLECQMALTSRQIFLPFGNLVAVFIYIFSLSFFCSPEKSPRLCSLGNMWFGSVLCAAFGIDFLGFCPETIFSYRVFGYPTRVHKHERAQDPGRTNPRKRLPRRASEVSPDPRVAIAQSGAFPVTPPHSGVGWAGDEQVPLVLSVFIIR